MSRPTNKEIRYRNVGRKSVMTDLVIGKLEEALKADCTIGEACSYADINESTYYDHIKSNSEFSKRMESAQKYISIVASKQRLKHIEKGDKQMIIEYKRRRDKRYKDKSEVEEKKKPDIEALKLMTTKQLEEYRKTLLTRKE